MDVDGVGEGVGVTVSCREGDLGMRRLHAAAPATYNIDLISGRWSNCSKCRHQTSSGRPMACASFLLLSQHYITSSALAKARWQRQACRPGSRKPVCWHNDALCR